MNILDDPTIVYDTNILEDIKELIKDSLNKLKSFVFNKNSKFNYYYDLKKDFNEIAVQLDKPVFTNEFTSFLSIKNHILHVVYRNCEKQFFGYYDFAVELLDLFMELLNRKIYLLKHPIEDEFEAYSKFFKKFQDKLLDMDKYFYNEIYEPITGDISEKEVYEFMNGINW